MRVGKVLYLRVECFNKRNIWFIKCVYGETLRVNRFGLIYCI